MSLLDPTNDLVFKLLLTRRPELLRHMLEGILARPIHRLDILNPDIPGELSHDKQIILDIRAQLADGTRSDVEMQVQTRTELPGRLVYYAARDYADQLHRGEPYRRLTPTAVAVWLVEPLFPEIERLHSIFELRDRYTSTRLSDHLAIHLMQLSCLSPATATGYDGHVQRWARFLVADPAELDRLAREDPIMTIAKQALEDLSQDPAARRRAREREDSIKLYQMSLAVSREEGRVEGEAKGRAEGEAKGRAEGKATGQAAVLLKQLQLRFGPLSDTHRARVESATVEQLDAWVERVLTAETLDAVLAD